MWILPAVIFWNCDSSTLPLILRKQPSAMKVIVVNGELLDYFPSKNITYLSASKVNTDSFNPGFVFKNQLLSVKSQVEEAEYCVLLYFYMRLLGYPPESILIWVSCRRMEILIGEVVSSKPDLKKKLGTPEILYNKSGEHDYVRVSYSIISMFSDEGYTEVDFSGKQGNYFVSSVLQRDSKLLQNTRLGPGNDLCIVKGETFGAKQERSLKGQEHKLKGISQLEKMVRSLE
ncbi:uncharacterized protein SPAPADRAFT_59916 [Spathaspora passalidarum NRRL Y-27907]|uniref:Uncharacterized protein n=1 Tax=Spathaspora passalidarum (strain NRRL Y-27907 / 11-Y1) TaxID=619300 RepID=G3AIR8_SPAPN|nr:uncharacterized protein SPAPADRAFT_59916 [Spathaspora passalidarum NRRL Y-27907]EGW34484.1 hypothetical protein SPAPADRAFT_59916 [Spathaspora passalidarum NRRL Y-27907]